MYMSVYSYFTLQNNEYTDNNNHNTNHTDPHDFVIIIVAEYFLEY